MNNLSDFYRDKKILITGHTGFKGTWLTRILIRLGAKVYGYSLPPLPTDSLYDLSTVSASINNCFGDIRDFRKLKTYYDEVAPEIVFHLAAQPLVRDSYLDPRYTYETNVMGTVNILECVRDSKSVKSVLNITTDKVYENKEWCWGYRENEPLDGFDPYSNSKSCSELVTHCYKSSFLNNLNIPISTARAGNVIGGGDFSNNRIIPDCIRAQLKHEPILVRNPHSIRPYQHVLEPLYAYLIIAMKQYANCDISDCYNVGPNEEDCVTTGDLVRLFCSHWAEGATWHSFQQENAPHEANYLKLDCSKIKAKLFWTPKWHIEEAVEKVCEWTKVWIKDSSAVPQIMDKQIDEYFYK